MANSRSSINSLISRVSRGKGTSSTKFGSPTDLAATRAGSGTQRSARPAVMPDVRNVSLGATSTVSGIDFGRPSSSSTTATTQSGSEWANLLKQTASGGIASFLGGGLGGFGGLGTLISGISSLFGGGGKSAPPALVEFQLPASQQQTVYASSKGLSVLSGAAAESTSAVKPGTGIYSGSQAGVQASNSLQYRSADIAQAVKTALLHSSTLNDVIAEI